MGRRIVTTVWVLFWFCASYAAPLSLALVLRGSGMSCCPNAKAASCCKRAHGAGWVANGSGCAAQCVAGLPASPAADAVTAVGTVRAELPVHGAAAARHESAPKSSSYPAFLYQLPPPVC